MRDSLYTRRRRVYDSWPHRIKTIIDRLSTDEATKLIKTIIDDCSENYILLYTALEDFVFTYGRDISVEYNIHQNKKDITDTWYLKYYGDYNAFLYKLGNGCILVSEYGGHIVLKWFDDYSSLVDEMDLYPFTCAKCKKQLDYSSTYGFDCVNKDNTMIKFALCIDHYRELIEKTNNYILKDED